MGEVLRPRRAPTESESKTLVLVQTKAVADINAQSVLSSKDPSFWSLRQLETWWTEL